MQERDNQTRTSKGTRGARSGGDARREPEKQKEWWRWQRSFGLALAVTEQAQGQDLVRLFRWSGSKAGLKRLRQTLRLAQPLECKKSE